MSSEIKKRGGAFCERFNFFDTDGCYTIGRRY